MYTFSSPRPQDFALSYSMMQHIRKKWSSTVYQKLTLTCKHFFATDPMLIMDKVGVPFSITYGDQSLPNHWNFHPDGQLSNNGRYINVGTHKIWIAKELIAVLDNKRLSVLCQLITKSTLATLTLVRSSISHRDLIKLTGNLHTFCLHNSQVLAENGEELSLGDVMAAIPSLTHLIVNQTEDAVELCQRSSRTLPIMPKLMILLIHCTSINTSEYCNFVKNHFGRTFVFKTPNPTVYNQLLNDLNKELPQRLDYLETGEAEQGWLLKFFHHFHD